MLLLLTYLLLLPYDEVSAHWDSSCSAACAVLCAATTYYLPKCQCWRQHVLFSSRLQPKMDPCRRVHEKIEEICPKNIKWDLKAISSGQFSYDNNFWRIKFDWVSTNDIFLSSESWTIYFPLSYHGWLLHIFKGFLKENFRHLLFNNQAIKSNFHETKMILNLI